MQITTIQQLLDAMQPDYSNVTQGNEGQPVTKPTDVWRVEMPNGKGPYNSDLPNAHEIYEVICAPEPGFDCSRLAYENNEQMGVTDEAFYQAHGHADYGCNSLAAIKQWFPSKARKYLSQYGAKIIEYELPVGAPLATIGNGEVIFSKETAHVVATMPITEDR